MRLGEMSFDGMFSYIAPLSFQIGTAPGYRIGKYIHPQEWASADLNQYLENRDSLRARAIQKGDDQLPEEVIRHKVKVYVYCPPCACQIATAMDVCQYKEESPFVTFHIRIDYRQPTSCCVRSSGIDGICSVIDYLKDIERNGNPDFIELDRMRLIDRMWMEQEEYLAGELDKAPEYSPESQLTRIFKYHYGEPKVAAIVILGETDHCVPLLGANPLPSLEAGSRFRENMMFMMKQERDGDLPWAWYWQRHYLASYSSEPPIVRNLSLPATVDKRQSEDRSEEKNKRPKTLVAGQ